jgi:hypothetical protein
MSKIKLTIVLLSIALVASNVWWACRLLDAGVTQTYLGVSLDDNKEALNQTLSLLPIVANPNASRAKIILAAQAPIKNSESYEKDGFVWIGKIGLKFNERGRLVEVSRAWSPP